MATLIINITRYKIGQRPAGINYNVNSPAFDGGNNGTLDAILVTNANSLKMS